MRKGKDLKAMLGTVHEIIPLILAFAVFNKSELLFG